MRKSTAILRGVAALLAFIMLVSMAATTLTFEYDSIINKAFGIKTTVAEKADDADADANIYYPNEYGYDETALTAVNLDAAAASVDWAAESVVLLKNDNAALPLSKGQQITIFGNAAEKTSDFASTTTVDFAEPYTSVTALQKVLGEENVNTQLVTNVYSKLSTSGTAEVIEAPIGDVKAYESSWQNGYNDAAVVFLGRWAREGNDMHMYSDTETYADGSPRRMLDLSVNEEALMAYLKEQKDAGVFKKIIVVFSTVFTMEPGFLDEYDVDAAIVAGEPGNFGWLGVAQVLSGEVNPSGHTAEIFATNSVSAPATAYAGYENTQTWANAAEVNEKNPDTNQYDGKTLDYYVIYAEGIYVSYKYYETRYEDSVLNQGGANAAIGSSTGSAWNYADEVTYPFGHGLSYTTFTQKLDSVKYNAADKTYTATVTVTNTGNVAGKDVVEIYAQTPYGDYEKENLVEKASVQLVAYDKTDLLEPGASETMEITFDGYFLASYDTYGAGTYILSQGDYYLAIGDNSHDALNNILAAKGYTVADGMTAEGNAGNAYKWTQDALDTETYRYSIYNGAEITNQFDDADIRYYGYDFTYLSRQDWEGTYPVTAAPLTATEEVISDLSNFYYEKPADAVSASTFTQGERAGISLTEMMDVALDDPKWDEFVDQLTLEEMSHLYDDNVTTQVVADLDIPGTSHKDDDQQCCGQFIMPYHAFMANSWNTDIHTERGYYGGIIAQLNGYDEIWYGANDFHRTPFGGRSNQYFSGDSTLQYWCSYNEANAMQATGTICCIKHFVINDQETNREGISTFTNEQALREIYLRSFEGGFAGGALSTMCSLGRIGTKLAKNNKALLTNVLRGEWDFQGHVTSDGWLPFLGYFQNSLEQIEAGMDYACMDTSNTNGSRIVAQIQENDDGNMLMILRQAAKRNLYVMAHTSRMNGLGSGTIVTAVLPTWEKALIVVDLATFIAFVVCTAWCIADYCKKRQPVIAVEKEA